ncbi:MAG: pyridoxamine 5'-phosphate oxidase family protein [Syntrophomonadaceae bacterium]|jgi:predicted pyridoxine 5'-phosphate oxidase superfamily flavin-nucleotide-binding protein
MAKLTQEMKDMIKAQQSFIATASKDGIPNIAPKGSTRVLDDETIVFQEGFGGQTYQNILAGSKVAICVVDRKAPDGYRFLGTPQVHTSGPVFDGMAEAAAQAGRPKPLAAIVIPVDEIYSVKPNKNAGKKIS